MPSYLTRLYQHLAWADQKTLAVLEAVDQPVDEAVKLFAHVVVAEHIWLSRATGQTPAYRTPWEPLTLAECRPLAEQNHGGYCMLLEGLPAAEMDKVITYRLASGAEKQSLLADILLHVALHGAHHRGQIASLLGRQGLPAPSMDYILFTLQG